MPDKPITTKLRKRTVKGWIGHRSWILAPLTSLTDNDRQIGALFETKEDAIKAGWKTPARVEVTVRVL